MDRPRDHHRRAGLNAELHARPPEDLTAPVSVSYLALLRDPALPDDELSRLAAFARDAGKIPPASDANHYRADFGAFRLKWERHAEFSRYMFIVEGLDDQPFAETALGRVPAAFVTGLPGELIAASHAILLPAGPDRLDLDRLAHDSFAGNDLIGSEIGGEAASAFTDFRIHADGFSRLVLRDRRLSPLEAGRLLQRLLEIDTYKSMALLAFPVAKSLVPQLGRAEKELAAITTSLATSRDADEDRLLDRLTRLEAEIESRGADNQFRFGAAAAYYDLVRQRIVELRETRIQGLPTFGEFIERRLAPAMNTCLAASTRQEVLSRRVARATQLLSTRVAVTQARQNQDLLGSMDRRAHLQLRLQQTVEGLSVAAVTYYIVGLVGYAAKGAKPLGLDLNPELVMAASIPVVLGLTALAIRRIRHSVSQARPADREGTVP